MNMVCFLALLEKAAEQRRESRDLYACLSGRTGGRVKKRFWSLVPVLLTVIALAGCGADQNKAPNPDGADVEKDASSDLNGAGADKNELPYLNETDVEKYVTLGDYRSIAASVAEDYLNALVLNTYNTYVTVENGITDRAVEIGDTVDIDYEGKKDGVAFAGGTAAGASLTIGSGQFINGFEDGLIGVMPGETVDLDLTFPEGYGNAELAGQPVVFTVTVNYIMPGLDEMEDSVVANIGIEDVNTVEELWQYACDILYSGTQNDYVAQLQNFIVDELIAQSTFEEIPEAYLEAGRETLTENLEDIAASYSISAEDYTYYVYGMSAEAFINLYAEMGVKQDFILQAIANKEGLSVSDEELQSQLEEYASNAGYDSVEEFVGELSKEDYRNYFMSEKVYKFLMEQPQSR